jgi:site-specific recombinase XerD
MASIKFRLIKESNPNIYVRFTDGRNIDYQMKTNYTISPNRWNFDKQTFKSNTAENRSYSEKLLKYENDILDAYEKLELHEKQSSKWLKNFINPPIQQFVPPNELVKYFDYYINIKKNEVAQSTIKKYNVVKHLLERLETDTSTIIDIKDVNNEFKEIFVSYCLDNHYADGTIQRSVKFIKTICLHAKGNNIVVSNQIQDFKFSTTKSRLKPIYLTFEELELIDSFDYSESLENVKDWLLISCYTGQRVSDFLRFKTDMINKRDGKPYIEFKQQKTKKLMAIALHKKVIEILNKRNGEFPKRISDQNYNLYIKEVCKIAGLSQRVKGSLKKEIEKGVFRKVEDYYEKWELTSSHIGRRSLASNFYSIIPTSLLMSMTGHSTERQFLEYIGKSEVDSAMQIHNYF